MDEFTKSVLEVASYVLGAEAIVLSIVYLGTSKANTSTSGLSSLVTIPDTLATKLASGLLIIAMATCVLVLMGSINYAAKPNSTGWKTLSQWSSNITVWLFFGSLFVLFLGIMGV